MGAELQSRAQARADNEKDLRPSAAAPVADRVQQLQRTAGNAAVARLLQTRRTLQRNEESAALLKAMAEPQVLKFSPEEIEVQTGIVTKLEAAVTQQQQLVTDKQLVLAEAEAGASAFGTWLDEFDDDAEVTPQVEATLEKGNATVKARDEAKDDLAAAVDRLNELDKAVTCLGAIELRSLPESDADLLREAKLVDLPVNSLGSRTSYALVEQVGAKDDVVRNTLNTMIKAGQIAYLRKSGVIGPGWMVLVEIHYYRKRDQTTSEFHKDTLGETLFVNLNYQTQHDIGGPEYLLHPPTVPTHEEQIAKSLPGEFLSDLAAIRTGAEEATHIEAPIIPSFGAVAFVDEAIHHMTPHRGHREIPSNDFKRYLDKYYGANTVGPSELDVWRAMSEKPDVSYTRPELKKAGMRHREIDKLLAEFGPPGFRTVNIPKATPYVGGTVTLTRTSPVPLKRRMSWRARKNQLPEPVTGQRRFFRTWVRAVKI